MEKVENHIVFDGSQEVWKHQSDVLNCEMKVAVYLPNQAKSEKLPVLYWLSGLTCTEQNFITKAGAQQFAAKHGIIIVAPDTSPRGDDVADDDGYDLGKGAGFYINATKDPWAKHYQMYDYVTQELPTLIEQNFPVNDKRSISGHSMGGHGAMICGLKNPDFYQSISAFSPICAPMQCPWGVKAFTSYLGDDQSSWEQWDSAELLKNHDGKPINLLIDQGLDDQFLLEQLKPELIEQAAQEANQEITVRRHEGYDHSYYFISSFIEDHINFHAKFLK